MRNRRRHNHAIRRIAMESVEFAGKNGDVAGERQFANAGAKQFGPQFSGRFYRPQTSLGDQHCEFPKADRRHRKTVIGLRLTGQFLALRAETFVDREPDRRMVSSRITSERPIRLRSAR